MQNDQLEKNIISLFLNYTHKREEIFLNIDIIDFADINHRNIYIKLIDAYCKDDKFTIVSLTTIFSGVSGLIKEYPMLPSDSVTSQYIKELKTLTARRKISKILDDTKKAILTNATNEKLISDMETSLASIVVGEATIERVCDIIDNNSEKKDFEKTFSQDIITGSKALDDMIKIKKGHYIIVAARPSIGKTAFMLWLADRISHNHNVGIISAEMMKESLLQRIAFSNTNDFGYNGYVKGCSQIADRPIWINDDYNMKIEQIFNISKIMIKRHGCEIILIDYLQLLSGMSKSSRYEVVTDLSLKLKRLAKTTKVPHIVLSQLSRIVESTKDKRPMLSHLKESGQIEQDADTILMCYRPGYYDSLREEAEKRLDYNPDKFDKFFQLIIAKQREFKIGEIDFEYYRDRNLFIPL